MRHIITLPGLVEANRKLDLLLAGGVLPVPPTLTNTAITAVIPYETVTGAPAAFDALQSTADDQDDRLTQLEAA